MRTPPRPLAALFVAAVLGVLVLLGVVAGELAGAAAVVGYVAVVVVSLGVAAARARRAAPPATPAHRCSCCDGDHAAPVRVV